MADAEVIVNGGAASPYSVAFNVSNASISDTGVSGVLNDDYAAVSTALLRPKLHVPKQYWDQRPMPWYTYVSSSDPAYTESTAVAGVISLSGSGSTTASDVIGYLVVDLVVEFHTLL